MLLCNIVQTEIQFSWKVESATAFSASQYYLQVPWLLWCWMKNTASRFHPSEEQVINISMRCVTKIFRWLKHGVYRIGWRISVWLNSKRRAIEISYCSLTLCNKTVKRRWNQVLLREGTGVSEHQLQQRKSWVDTGNICRYEGWLILELIA